jgi:hypothetical protein
VSERGLEEENRDRHVIQQIDSQAAFQELYREVQASLFGELPSPDRQRLHSWMVLLDRIRLLELPDDAPPTEASGPLA